MDSFHPERYLYRQMGKKPGGPLPYSSIQCDAERFHSHHTSKHFAAGVVVMVLSAMTTVSEGCDCFANFIKL